MKKFLILALILNWNAFAQIQLPSLNEHVKADATDPAVAESPGSLSGLPVEPVIVDTVEPETVDMCKGNENLYFSEDSEVLKSIFKKPDNKKPYFYFDQDTKKIVINAEYHIPIPRNCRNYLKVNRPVIDTIDESKIVSVGFSFSDPADPAKFSTCLSDAITKYKASTDGKMPAGWGKKFTSEISDLNIIPEYNSEADYLLRYLSYYDPDRDSKDEKAVIHQCLSYQKMSEKENEDPLLIILGSKTSQYNEFVKACENNNIEDVLKLAEFLGEDSKKVAYNLINENAKKLIKEGDIAGLVSLFKDVADDPGYVKYKIEIMDELIGFSKDLVEEHIGYMDDFLEANRPDRRNRDFKYKPEIMEDYEGIDEFNKVMDFVNDTVLADAQKSIHFLTKNKVEGIENKERVKLIKEYGIEVSKLKSKKGVNYKNYTDLVDYNFTDEAKKLVISLGRTNDIGRYGMSRHHNGRNRSKDGEHRLVRNHEPIVNKMMRTYSTIRGETLDRPYSREAYGKSMHFQKMAGSVWNRVGDFQKAVRKNCKSRFMYNPRKHSSPLRNEYDCMFARQRLMRYMSSAQSNQQRFMHASQMMSEEAKKFELQEQMGRNYLARKEGYSSYEEMMYEQQYGHYFDDDGADFGPGIRDPYNDTYFLDPMQSMYDMDRSYSHSNGFDYDMMYRPNRGGLSRGISSGGRDMYQPMPVESFQYSDQYSDPSFNYMR